MADSSRDGGMKASVLTEEGEHAVLSATLRTSPVSSFSPLLHIAPRLLIHVFDGLNNLVLQMM